MPASPVPPGLVTRRRLLLGAGGALGAGLTAACSSGAGASEAERRRAARRREAQRKGRDSRLNVLWIITDDATRRTLETMPYTMDQLVGQGVNFTNGYVAVPWCGPARASMLTGMYLHNHGCDTNKTHRAFVHKGLDQDTVATRLSAAGYVNGYFGKYMNGQAQDPAYVAPGWDRWVTLTDSDSQLNVDGTDHRLDPDGDVPDQFSADHCSEFIVDNAGHPWFAVFAPTAPHDPYTPSAEHVHDFDGVTWDPPAFNERNLGDKAPFLRSDPEQEHHKMRRIWEGKLEELRDVDDEVRELMVTLADTGQLEDTVIIMVSDNGYLLGEHRLFQKKQPYEESTGIPFVVRGPGFATGAPRALVSQVDLMPTTLAIAGLDPDAGRALDGRSMLANLRSGDWSDWRRRLLSENPKQGWAQLREGNLAYIDYYAHDAAELYDLRKDPHQMRSVPASASARAASVRSRARREVDALRGAGGLELRALEV
ncbi:sulfatase [Nocardioides koreensis]|uniref:Sulfatase n=1 Tax=Nocardioides koreensis TaxID=433651 RepID=A0ABP5LYR4_9ACTN